MIIGDYSLPISLLAVTDIKVHIHFGIFIRTVVADIDNQISHES